MNGWLSPEWRVGGLTDWITESAIGVIAVNIYRAAQLATSTLVNSCYLLILFPFSRNFHRPKEELQAYFEVPIKAFALQKSFFFSFSESEPPRVGRNPEIIAHPRYTIASKGSNVTLKCDVMYVRSYLADWYWLLNGTEFTPGRERSRYKEDTFHFDYNFTMVLHILNVSERDEGLYECLVFGLVETKSPFMTLTIDEKGKSVFVILYIIQLTPRWSKVKRILYFDDKHKWARMGHLAAFFAKETPGRNGWCSNFEAWVGNFLVHLLLCDAIRPRLFEGLL